MAITVQDLGAPGLLVTRGLLFVVIVATLNISSASYQIKRSL